MTLGADADPRDFGRNMARLFESARRACDVWNEATGRRAL